MSAYFHLHSPNIRIEVIRHGDVRRAKLYYLRDRTGKSARIAERPAINWKHKACWRLLLLMTPLIPRLRLQLKSDDPEVAQAKAPEAPKEKAPKAAKEQAPEKAEASAPETVEATEPEVAPAEEIAPETAPSEDIAPEATEEKGSE